MVPTLILLTIGLPWFGALLVWLAGDRGQNRGLLNFLAVAFSAGGGLASLALIWQSGAGTALTFAMGTVFGDFTFAADGLGVFLAAIAAVIGTFAVIFSIDYMKDEPQTSRYYALVLFFIGSMAGLVLTSNLLLVFVFWEITALCSFALISFHNDDPKAVAGGIKALVITQLGGIGLMVGALLVFSATGSFEINAFLANYEQIPAGLLSVIAFGFLIAAAAKSAQFPFQTWLPDAMEAPTPISALIHAATMVNAGVYLLARFYPAFEGVAGWKTAVMAVGALTALMAAIMALAANDLKRVLAYSTVSQLGYMVYAVGAGGFFASQFHLMSHSVFKALLFLGAGAVIHAVGTRDMRLMGSLGRKMPFVRAMFLMGALALAGLPIFNGFWSKELVLEEGLANGGMFLYLVMLLGAGLTALYTFRCVWLVFYGQPRSDLHVHPTGNAMKIALVPLAVGSISTWLLAGPFGRLLHETMPFHETHIDSTLMMVEEVAMAPATLVALAVIGLGLAAWWQRGALQPVARAFSGFNSFAADSFGFEAINRLIVRATHGLAERLRGSQTGRLNWNVMGIIGCLVVLLVILAVGA